MSEPLETLRADREQSPQFDRQDLEAQIELLTEENRRLRGELQAAKRTKYRRTAIGLGVVGGVSLVGAYLFPTVRTLLIAIAATGLFAGVLTYFITPDRFVAASISEGIYQVVNEIGNDLTTELGLRSERLYVPVQSDAREVEVRLFIPQQADHVVPSEEALKSLFVITESERSFGVALPPTGNPLFREFEKSVPEPLSEDPLTLVEELVDALVGQFELIDGGSIDPDLDNDNIVIGIAGSSLGSIDRFDHPVSSFLGVGMAAGMDRRISISVRPSEDDDRFDYLVDCSWESR